MGLNRSDFKKDDFKNLSWQTSILKEEIASVLSLMGKKIALLPTLFDIDTIWDIKIIGKNTFQLPKVVVKAIQSLISTTKKNRTPVGFLF